MKFSVMTTSMLFELLEELPKGDMQQHIRRRYKDIMAGLASIGITSVDLTSLEYDVFGADFVKTTLQDYHLQAANLIHMDQFADTDPEHTAGIVQGACAKIDTAAQSGIDHVMMGLMAGPDAGLSSMDEKRAALIRNLTPVAAYGAEKGIYISVEDTPDLRLPLCSSEEVLKICQAVPHLGLTFDTGNMMLRGEDPVHFYHATRKYICSVHLKDMCYCIASDTNSPHGDPAWDGNYMEAALHGNGLVNFHEIMHLLRENHYDQWMTIEYVGHGDHMAHIQNAKQYLETM